MLISWLRQAMPATKTGAGCDENREQADHCQQAGAALADNCFERRQESEGDEADAGDPEAGEQRGDGIGVAARTAFLDGLEDIADGFAIVVRGKTIETCAAKITGGLAQVRAAVGGAERESLKDASRPGRTGAGRPC
jgi:hypothetical protein